VVRGKLILVDGLIVPGNSGGPVVIEGGVRVRRRQTTGPLEFSQSMDNFVVGIVSSSLGPSGLTTVISSDYIRDMMTTYVPNPSK
jgi:S1-C subfamily serine protease